MHRVMGIQRTRRAVPPKTGSAYLHGPSQPESAGPEQAQRPAAAPFRPPDLARSARQNRGPKGKSSRLCSEQLPRKNLTPTYTRYTGAGRRVTAVG
jgi:hypothetical protein